MSVKCPEMVLMNLHIIGNTLFGYIVTQCIFIIPIGFRLFAIADFISIVNNRKKNIRLSGTGALFRAMHHIGYDMKRRVITEDRII